MQLQSSIAIFVIVVVLVVVSISFGKEKIKTIFFKGKAKYYEKVVKKIADIHSSWDAVADRLLRNPEVPRDSAKKANKTGGNNRKKGK